MYMALNVEMLKEPKVLIIGVGLVGGIILVGKLKAKQSASTVPTEVPVSYSVQSADSTEQQDTLQRSLTDAQDKYNQLLSKQEQDQRAYQDQLNNLQQGSATERQSFEQRIGELGTQYSSQLSSLENTIKQLQAQLDQRNATVPTPQQLPSGNLGGGNQSGGGTPQQPIAQQPISTPIIQPQVPVQNVKHYPGLPDNYVLDCSNKPTALRFSSFDAAVADQKKKNIKSATFLARNMVTIAISGGTSPWIIGWDAAAPNDLRRYQINAGRVYWGLQPLTREEMDALSAHMRQLWDFTKLPEPQRTQTFNNLNAYARPLWERWNLPYQCGSSQVRR